MWRLARCVGHGFHGLAVVVFRFPRLSLAGRRARIAWWSAKMVRLIGITLVVEGEPRRSASLLVLNHISWIDIMVVHAVLPEARFVSKADVKGWPLLAQLIDSAETIYLEREKKRDALRVIGAIGEALREGGVVAIFPEGTTSAGHGLLPFHANLLQAAIAGGTPVQPAALRFSDRTDAVSEAMDFTGETTLAESLWRIAGGDGVVARLSFLPPVESAGTNRRELADRLRDEIAAGLSS